MYAVCCVSLRLMWPYPEITLVANPDAILTLTLTLIWGLMLLNPLLHTSAERHCGFKVKNFNNGNNLCVYNGTGVLSCLSPTILITFCCYIWDTGYTTHTFQIPPCHGRVTGKIPRQWGAWPRRCRGRMVACSGRG